MNNNVKISGVYQIVNMKNGKSYVGSSANIYSRWKIHRSLLNKNKHHSIYLQRAWNKHKPESFAVIVLESCSPNCLYEKEKLWYNTLKPEYNVADIIANKVSVKQICPTCQQPKSYKAKECRECSKVGMSIKHSGKNNPFFGKSPSKSALRKMSVAQTGRKQSEEIQIKKRASNPQCKPITINGITYDSQELASKALGITGAALIYRIKRGLIISSSEV